MVCSPRGQSASMDLTFPLLQVIRNTYIASGYTIILNHPRGWGGKPTGSHGDSRVAEMSPDIFAPAFSFFREAGLIEPAVVTVGKRRVHHLQGGRGKLVYLGIRFKLSLLTCLLVTAVIIVSSTIVMKIMDIFLLEELVKRGLSLSRGAANAAGYSMLARDRLSLDNLVAKLKERQKDIIYVAVIDHRGRVAAHSELLKSGSNFKPETGVAIHKDSDGAVATRVTGNGKVSYEFGTPIVFAGKEIGQFHLGIDAAALTAAQAAARRKVAVMAVIILFLSVAGTCYIARIFTRPIKQLNDGVFLLKSGSNLGNLTVTQHDELGELTMNFNEMAGVIMNQQDKLAEYARGLEESYLATVKILATSIDARDDYTM